MPRFLVLFILFFSIDSCQKNFDVKYYLSLTKAVAFQSDSGGSNQDSSSAPIDSLFRHLKKHNAFNGAVLIAQNGKILLHEAVGFSNFKTKDSLTIQTAFQLASVSKQFTAAAIMMLREQGQLDYSDSLQKFFPDFPYKKITIRQLLTHRSGLPNYTYFCDQYCREQPLPLTNADVIRLMTEKKPAVHFQPNRRFQYSNTGYVVLAAVVEKVSGKSFAEYLDENIFEPLEMKHTFVHDATKDLSGEKIATGHTWRKRPVEKTIFDGVTGDKGIYSTVEDLYRWNQALDQEVLLKQETLQEAWTPATKTYRYNQAYGFGWRISSDENDRAFQWHAGWWEGFKTYLLRRPSDHATIIVLSNLVKGSFISSSEILSLLTPTNAKEKPLASHTDSVPLKAGKSAKQKRPDLRTLTKSISASAAVRH